MVDRGMSHQQIADAVRADTGHPITRSSVSAAISRAGITKTQGIRYTEELPWRVSGDHLLAYPARMLRLLGRRRHSAGLKPEESDRLDAWLRHLAAEGAVVAYHPTRGFLYVPARPGVDGTDGIPIRRAALTDADFA